MTVLGPVWKGSIPEGFPLSFIKTVKCGPNIRLITSSVLCVFLFVKGLASLAVTRTTQLAL